MSDVVEFRLRDKVVLKHIFDCGQCFRFVCEEDGSYSGVFRRSFINVSLQEQGNIMKVKRILGESIDEEELYRFFDLESSYERIKEKFKAIEACYLPDRTDIQPQTVSFGARLSRSERSKSANY